MNTYVEKFDAHIVAEVIVICEVEKIAFPVNTRWDEEDRLYAAWWSKIQTNILGTAKQAAQDKYPNSVVEVDDASYPYNYELHCYHAIINLIIHPKENKNVE